MLKTRNVKISEMIKELEKAMNENGDLEVMSIGTTSGSKSSFVFRINTTGEYDNEDKEIYVRCRKEK